MAGIFLINPLLSEELELNLVELAVFVSEANNKNILVDESLRGENIVFIVNDKQDFFLEAFEKALNLKGLELIKNEKFYFVVYLDINLEKIIAINTEPYICVYFNSNSETLTLEELKNYTKLKPTKTFKKGDLRKNTKVKYKFNAFQIEPFSSIFWHLFRYAVCSG